MSGRLENLYERTFFKGVGYRSSRDVARHQSGQRACSMFGCHSESLRDDRICRARWAPSVLQCGRPRRGCLRYWSTINCDGTPLKYFISRLSVSNGNFIPNSIHGLNKPRLLICSFIKSISSSFQTFSMTSHLSVLSYWKFIQYLLLSGRYRYPGTLKL